MTIAAPDLHPPVPASTVANCLSFPGFSNPPNNSPHVNHGFFFDYDKNIGSSGYWDWICAPTGGGYLICDGDGGAHGVLAGFSPAGTTPQSYVQGGNLWGSDAAAHPVGSYGANEGPLSGEWGHHALCLYTEGGSNIVLATYWNGLVTGVWLLWTVASGTQRRYPGAGSGSGPMLIGAGSHNNYTGKLAEVRGVEQANPLGTYLQPFVPPRALGAGLLSATFDPDFLSSYAEKQLVVADQSYGWTNGVAAGTRKRHPGVLSNWYNGQGFPTWTYDSTCPAGVSGDLTNTVGLGSAANPIATPTLPTGARIYDGCNRAPQDWFWQAASGPDIGSTDSRASLGALAWQQHMIGGDDVTNWSVPVVGRAWALRNGFFRCYEAQPCISYVDNNSTVPTEVRISRMGTSDMGHCAMVISGNDRNNFLALTTLQAKNGGANKDLYMFNYVTGSNTLGFGTSFSPPTANWTTMRTVRSGGSLQTVTVYVDDGASGWINLGTYADATYNTNTSSKCGFANLGGAGVAGGSNWAGRRFTVI